MEARENVVLLRQESEEMVGQDIGVLLTRQMLLQNTANLHLVVGPLILLRLL